MSHIDLYLNIINIENLYLSWQEFRKGKRKRPDVQFFERYLEDNLFQLHSELNKVLNELDSLQISLDGSSSQVNDKIRGEGSFERIIEGIKNCLKNGLIVSINTTLMDKNVTDCVNIYKLVSRFESVSRYTFFTLMQAGRGKNLEFNPEKGLDIAIKLKEIKKKNKSFPKVLGFLGYLQEVPEYAEAIKDLYGKKINFISRNTAGISSIDVDSVGDVYPSSYLQFDELKAGNIKQKSIHKLWHNKKWNQLRDFSNNLYNKCRICDKKEYCGYGTIVESYINCRKFNKQKINCNFMTGLKSKRLKFCPPKKQDFAFLKKLWESGRVMEYVGFPKGLSQPDKKIKAWIENWSNKDRLRLIVVDKKTNKPIGETGYRVDKDYQFSKAKTAALDIKLTPNYWGKGLATEALNIIIPYIFNQTDIENIQVTPNVENTGALKLYEKLGFEKVGDPVMYKTKDATIKCQYYQLNKDEFNKL